MTTPPYFVNYKEFNFKNIKFLKPEKRLNTIIYPIRYINYLDNKKYQREEWYIIKTPKLQMLYPPQIINQTRYYLSLYFTSPDIEHDPEQKSFYDFLVKLDQKMSNFKKYTKGTQYKPTLKSDFFFLNFYPDEILTYDRNKEKIKLENVLGGTYGIFLIELKSLWITSEKYGLSWEIKQAKMEERCVLNRVFFLDEIPSDKEEIGPEYQPYFKMLKMGIPLLAVKQKMTLKGLNPDIISQKPNKLTQFEQFEQSEINTNLLLESKLSLKKVDKDQNQNQKKWCKKKKSLPVPSLDEIQMALKSLRKTPPKPPTPIYI